MIGNLLKRMRLIYGYKALEISEQLGVSASYLSEIENEKKQPSLSLLKSYSNIFGFKLSSLILLSEDIEGIEKLNKNEQFIRNKMINLINTMSSDTVEILDEDDSTKV